MEIRQLEHFVAVAEERSFTHAARRLNYVQSALSVSIQALERELDVRLFDRTTHRVALTDAGDALLPSARQAIFAFQQTRERAAELTGVLRGRLRLGMMQAFAFIDVPDLLGQFHRDHPGVEIELHPSAGGSATLIDELREGATDIAFVSVDRDPAGVSAVELGVEELVLVGGAELVPRSRRRVELADLAHLPFVDFPSGWGVRSVND